MEANKRLKSASSGFGSLRVWFLSQSRQLKVVLVSVALVIMLGLALTATWFSSRWSFVPWLLSGYLASLVVFWIRWPGKAPIWILNLLPGFTAALDYRRTLGENEGIADALEHALKVYEISAGKPFKDLSKLSALHSREKRIGECCLKAARQMGAAMPETLAEDLEVLFYDVAGETPSQPWSGSNKLQLATTLLDRSGYFKKWRKKLNLQPEHLAEILEWQACYSLASAEAELERITDLWRAVVAFYEFLAANDLPLANASPSLSTLLAIVRSVKSGVHPSLLGLGPVKSLDPPNQRQLLALLDLGKDALRSTTPDAAELERRCLLSLAAFLTRHATGKAIKPAVCELLALQDGDPSCAPYNRGGIRLSWEYLKTKQDFRNGFWKCSRPYLSLGEFFPVWDARFKNHLSAAALDQELDVEYLALLNGKWTTSREELLQQMLFRGFPLGGVSGAAVPAVTPAPAPPSGGGPGTTAAAGPPQQLASPPPVPTSWPVPSNELLPLFPGIRKEILELAGDLELSTVERFLESKTVVPYLITLGPSSGPLPKLLDCLTSERKLKDLEKKGIQLEGTYDFDHYTPYSRVGILPEGVSFEVFAQRFRRDVETLIKHQAEILAACAREPVGGYYEILLHTFNPAAYNPFWFGRPKAGRAAVQRIKDVFARKLPERVYRMVAYEWSRRLREVILHTPLADPNRDVQGLSAEDLRAMEEAGRMIKLEFLDELAKSGLDPLWIMEPATEIRQHGVQLLASLIGRHVAPLTRRPELCGKLAETFLDHLWFYTAAAAHGELADPTPVLRGLKIEDPTSGWKDLAEDDRQALREADERIKRLWMNRLGIDERGLFSCLDRPSPLWRRAVEELSAAITAEVPSLDRPETRERLAQVYLETVRLAMQARTLVELARVRGLLVREGCPVPSAAAA